MTGNIPGVIVAGEAQIAECLGWSMKGFREGFAELYREGLAKASWSDRLIWIVNALKYNEPDNPNVVKSWKSYWDEVPECNLKDEIQLHFVQYFKAKGIGFQTALINSMPNPLRNPFGNGSPNGMPNQEQEQEQDLKDTQTSGACVGNSKKTTTKKKAATTTELNPIPAPLNTPEFTAAWEAWKTHRNEIKHPLTATSYNTILSKCEKLGAVEAVRWIWNAIEKGWRGLYPPDDDKNKGSNNGTSNGRMGSGIEKFFGADEKYEAKDRHVSSEDKPQPPENLFAKSDS
jgi:hypothetical protein